MIGRLVLLVGFMGCLLGACAKIPCRPASYYRPDADAPYTAEDVRVATATGHVLAGTLTLPIDIAPPFAGVLLITGSSPLDRDHVGSRLKPISNYKPFRQIADAVSRKGMAVLRLDDQGVGCSGGGPLENVTIQARADDSRAAIAYLRSRQDIDAHRIGLLGLSEGGNIGPIIAASDPTLRALVIMAGSATNGLRIREYQDRLKLAQRSDLTESQKERQLAKSMRGIRQALARGEGSPWVRSFFYYMPLPTARQVTCPVLILHGDRDAHVPVKHADYLARTMRLSGNEDVTVKIFTDHNHLFLEDPDGRISGYYDLLRHTHQLPPHVLNSITTWLLKHM